MTTKETETSDGTVSMLLGGVEVALRDTFKMACSLNETHMNKEISSFMEAYVVANGLEDMLRRKRKGKTNV